MLRRLSGLGLPLAAALAAGAACGQWRRVGSEKTPAPEVVLPGMFDLSAAYHHMGFLAHGSPVAFVGAIRFLAGPGPDSTLALFAASLPNNSLSFRRTATGFEASYHVDVHLSVGLFARRISSNETVRVASFQETQRADESVIFQKSVYLPPGRGWIEVTFQDVNTVGFSRDSAALTVPRFDAGPAFSDIVPMYQGSERRTRAAPLDLLANPRGTVPFGSDTLRLYLEAYGVDSGTAVRLRALDETGNEVWTATSQVRGDSMLAALVARVGPGTLPVGEVRFEATFGARDTARAPVLVSFSDQWVIANLDDVIRVLRYFGYDEELRALKAATAPERPALWRKFWRDTDPNPLTPENEALVQYFARVQQANLRFREGADAGWLTDRGEVFINLGEPDGILDQSSELQSSRRAIRWTYNMDRLVLDFVDDSGFGRFRLTPSSRAEYQRVLARVRRA